MNLADLRSLDINNVGAWPLPVKGIAVALMFTAVLGLGYWFESQGQLPELDQARQQEKDLKAVFSAKAAKAANLEAYKQQLEEMKQSFGAMLRQLPNKTQVADLLVDISQTGLASGLEFELFKPEAEIPKDFYAELPITIRVKGHYHDFGAFVSGVAALPRIVTIHDISIKPSEKDGSRLVMDLTAKTYRYLEEEGAK
ncbi:MAG: type IV pilus inner membrane component PilO [Gammaproteobacteria bacterium]